MLRPELDQIVNMDQIPNYSVFESFMNTEYQIILFLKMNEYWIVLFGLNYSNTEYLKSNSSPPQKNLYVNFVTNEMRKIWSFIFIPTWGLFTVFSTHILLIKNSRTIRYLVTTIQVFKYYSKITNGLNTNYE